jgi:vitamin B12 transporter
MHRRRVVTVMCALLIGTIGVRGVSALADEGAIRGTVIDPQGAVVASAAIALLKDGTRAGTATSDARGEFAFTGLGEGRYQIEVRAPGFEPHTTEPVFVGATGGVVTEVPLQIGAVKQDVLVTASATELPQSRTGAAVTVIDAAQLDGLGKIDVLEALRIVPGASLTQAGGRGGTAALSIRGGNLNFNKILIDGVPANEIGGAFDVGDLATAGFERIEVMRGSNSALFGGDAMTGVVSLVTKRGRQATPELTYALDGGNLGTLRNDLAIGGAYRRFDYFGEYSHFRTDNDVPNNAFTNGAFAGRFGAALASGTDLSVTIRRKDTNYQAPNATRYYGIADDSFQTAAFTTVGATLQSQIADRWRATGRFGATRQRYHFDNPSPTGTPFDPFGFGANYLGNTVTIGGANGASVTGRAILDYGGVYPQPFDSRTDRQGAYGQMDYHAAGGFDLSGGLRYEHEAGFTAAAPEPDITRNNGGAFAEARVSRGRMHVTAGVAYDRNAVFGSAVSPRASLAAYLTDPSLRGGSDTKLVLNAGKGIKAPNVFQEQSSLYTLLGPRADAIGVPRTGPERTRSVDVGVDQGVWGGRARVRVSYFRNRFDDLLEYVNKSVLPQLGISTEAANATEFGAYVNAQSFRAQGLEASADIQASRALRITAAYTRLDAEVLASLSDGVLAPAINPAFPGTLIGQYAPLVGARPFRRPASTGSVAAVYAKDRVQLGVSGYFAGVSDDSTFLSDGFFGYSMLLPNQDLTPGYAKVDVSGAYRVHRLLRWHVSVENVLNRDYQPVPGFPALPATLRTGVTLLVGGRRP